MPQPSPFYVEPSWYCQFELGVKRGFPVALRGPAGTGKTTATVEMARRTNRPMVKVGCHADLMVEELRGANGLKSGNTSFQDGPVTRAAREGALLLVDEANLARPGALAWLNNLLDGSRTIHIPETGEDVPVHAGFRCVLAWNDNYQGTRKLNEALVDRCLTIHIDYPSQVEEMRILRGHIPRLAVVDARRVTTVALGIREARRKGTIDFDLSIRTEIMWVIDAYERTASLLDSFKAVVIPKVGDPFEHASAIAALTEIATLVLKEK